MKRALLPSKAFIRSAKRLTKRDPSLAADLETVLTILEEDAFHPSLRTHKLKGKLSKSWACSAGYDLRVVSQLVKHEGREALLLEAAGTHDEVY
ncbi:MAG: type II toxin-antitoxin system YafQ family toxin [Verrucomicrobiaceae bacterium]|jgi:mRNA-degrading endonuclease YafQ of YafQ-DinJ toxin-antitoxin module|nr:type II toxin-antitoxin system YafQ family toxin [Verrucomicrobiaceae bacterium]